jgi:hypothetical protein
VIRERSSPGQPEILFEAQAGRMMTRFITPSPALSVLTPSVSATAR